MHYQMVKWWNATIGQWWFDWTEPIAQCGSLFCLAAWKKCHSLHGHSLGRGSLHGLDDGLFGLHCLGWLHGLGALHGQFWLLCLHGLPGLGILDQLAPWGFGSLQLVQIGFGENPLDVALVLVCPQHGAPHGHSKQWKDFTTDLEVGVAHCFQNILANLELDVEPCIKRSIVASPRGTWIISGSSNLLFLALASGCCGRFLHRHSLLACLQQLLWPTVGKWFGWVAGM